MGKSFIRQAMLHLNNRKVGSPLRFRPNTLPHMESQLMEQIPSCAHQCTLFISKERVCDKGEDLALVLSQVERVTKGNIIYHLQNNLQPLIFTATSVFSLQLGSFHGENKFKLSIYIYNRNYSLSLLEALT